MLGVAQIPPEAKKIAGEAQDERLHFFAE